jgi:uncharacterized protein YndB with AHSA1/START domain
VAAPRSDERVPADEPIIEFTRLLDAPRALVWEVFTDPKHLAHWWGPDGFSITTHRHAARAGGLWDFVMHGPDGRDWDNTVAYREVVAPERLVYTHGSPTDPDMFHVTITFADEGTGTRLVMRSRFPSLAVRDHLIREVGAVEGGRQTLGRLAVYLKDRQTKGNDMAEALAHMAQIPGFDMSPVKAGTTLDIVRIFDAPRALVFQCWTDPVHLRAWWGPAGSDNGETRVDLRPGGELFIHMRGPGFDHPMGGEFLEIDPPRRLVFLSKAFKDADGNWEFVNKNTVTFEDAGDGRTKMTLNCVVQSGSKTMIVPVGGMQMGWNGSLDRLAEHLSHP